MRREIEGSIACTICASDERRDEEGKRTSRPFEEG